MQRKVVTIAWHKVCKPYSEGGFGIRKISSINDAANLKLRWDFSSSSNQWAQLLRHRVMRNNIPISYHIFPSIWSGIKSNFPTVTEKSRWNIGDGKTINFLV